MLFRKIGIVLSSILFLRCNESSPADYYSYLETDINEPVAQAIDDSKLQIHFDLVNRLAIRDTNKTENISFKINFRGTPKAYPDDLQFQFMVDDKQFQLPDTINYSVFTSIDREGKTFQARLTTTNIQRVINTVKNENNLPDSAYIINISGTFPEISMNNSVNPKKIKIELKAFSKGKIFYEKARFYELKKPRLYKTRSRPFG